MSMVFALILFGCADDGSACQRLSAPTEHYITKAQCEASQEHALQSDVALRSDYPTVVTQCLKSAFVPAMGNRRVDLSSRIANARGG